MDFSGPLLGADGGRFKRIPKLEKAVGEMDQSIAEVRKLIDEVKHAQDLAAQRDQITKDQAERYNATILNRLDVLIQEAKRSAPSSASGLRAGPR